MPGFSGWELSSLLRGHRPDVPVVLMSAYADAAASPADGIGAVAFLEKAFTLEKLRAVVGAALAEGLSTAAPVDRPVRPTPSR